VDGGFQVASNTFTLDKLEESHAGVTKGDEEMEEKRRINLFITLVSRNS
jgi:hypothetical protein